MPDWVMFLISPILVAVLAMTARQAAIDLDRRGQPGWVYGLLVMFVWPLGLAAWLLARGRHPLEPDQGIA